MGAKKNVIIYRGIDTYSLEEALTKGVGAIRERFGEHNISYIDASDTETNWKNLESEVVSSGLFGEKRLFLIRHFAIKLRKGGEEDQENLDEEASMGQKESSLMKIVETISDEHILIIISPEIPKTKKIYKFLEAESTIKEFNTPFDRDTWINRYGELNEGVIQKVLSLYEERENPKEPRAISYDIANTLEHIKLYGLSHSNYHPKDFISIEKESIIFEFLDQIYAMNAIGAKKKLRAISENGNIYELMGGIISNLRNTLYIKLLSKHMNEAEIGKYIKVHPYVLKKTLQSRISYEKMREFFEKLIEANVAQKSGKGMQEGELGLLFSIELGILGLQK